MIFNMFSRITNNFFKGTFTNNVSRTYLARNKPQVSRLLTTETETTFVAPKIRTFDDLQLFANLDKQPELGIVTRSFNRAHNATETRKRLGETPILDVLKYLEKNNIKDGDQVPILHGEHCGNMYTQHPDRLIPFWLRCKEMNLTNLFLQMFQFPDETPLWMRGTVVQCYMDIVKNIQDIESGIQTEGKVDAKTEAAFTAFRRVADIKIRNTFLDNAFNIWSTRIIQVNTPNGFKIDRSELIKMMVSTPEKFDELSTEFWLVNESGRLAMNRKYIWHDTDTGITSDTPNVFLTSCFEQMYYGSQLVNDFLADTDFDIDPSQPTKLDQFDDQVRELLYKTRLIYNPSQKVSNTPYKSLQKLLVCLNDLIGQVKYEDTHLANLKKHCDYIQYAQETSHLLAQINPTRFGRIYHLINHAHVYLSVTARVREQDVFDYMAADISVAKSLMFSNPEDALKTFSIDEASRLTLQSKPYQWVNTSGRVSIIKDCFSVWEAISAVAPVHLTIADFGTVNPELSLIYADKIKPSNDSVLFPLPERPEDTAELIKLLDNQPDLMQPLLNDMGILLGKSDQIKRSRAPFYTLSLNLKLARLINENKRYVGNGSTIIRGGTLDHFGWASLGSGIGLGKTVQQGDGFRSIANEYMELFTRAKSNGRHQSLFELVSIFCGPASKDILDEYKLKIAEALAEGALKNYPQEASRGHFKNLEITERYNAIMAIEDKSKRIQEIIEKILPNMRAIPETNIALSREIYPVEQDLKVATLYSSLLITFKNDLINFYSPGSTINSINGIDDALMTELVKHRQSLSDSDLNLILSELLNQDTPPAKQFAINMVEDTLKQLPDGKMRTCYSTIFKSITGKSDKDVPKRINTGKRDELIALRPI